MRERGRALIVDGRPTTRESLLRVCRGAGLSGSIALSWPEAKEELRSRYYDLVLICSESRGHSCVAMIRDIRELGLDSCILIVAPPRRHSTIVECLSNGAYDNILTPVHETWAAITVSRAIERRKYYAGAQMKDHYRRLSIFDDLTRIHNHRYFHQSLSRGISAAARYQYPFSILLMDLDNFKAYNDAHGHLAGDQALRALGAFLGKSIRAGDIAARYGGEEFVLFFPQTDEANAVPVIERMQRRFQQLSEAHNHLRISFSAVVVEAPRDGNQFDVLCRRADEAMYSSKEHGKARVTPWRPDMRHAARPLRTP